MSDWRRIEKIPLDWMDGRTVRVRLSRIEGQRELDAFWQDSGEMAGHWVSENVEAIIRPQLYLHITEHG